MESAKLSFDVRNSAKRNSPAALITDAPMKFVHRTKGRTKGNEEDYTAMVAVLRLVNFPAAATGNKTTRPHGDSGEFAMTIVRSAAERLPASIVRCLREGKGWNASKRLVKTGLNLEVLWKEPRGRSLCRFGLVEPLLASLLPAAASLIRVRSCREWKGG